MTPLYLLRHGPTAASEGGAPLGSLDLPVTPEGEARWPTVKAELHALGLKRVLCSPLQRSRVHAEDLGLPWLVLAGLAEQDFGAWDGRPWAKSSTADPIATQAFFADPVNAAPPGGESFDRAASRAVTTLQAALEGEAATLVLAHGGPLRALLAHFLGMPLARAGPGLGTVRVERAGCLRTGPWGSSLPQPRAWLIGRLLPIAHLDSLRRRWDSLAPRVPWAQAERSSSAALSSVVPSGYSRHYEPC